MGADSYDFKAIEPEILEFWDKNSIYRKAKEKNKGGKKFYFLDGPPYTSGKAHLGHAWNKALKDSVLRFLRMRGLDIWDRAGYDMHGLPTEREVEKKLGISHKEEIPKFGIAKYIEECRAFSVKNMHSMNSDFKRIGVWMDFENAYQPIENSYIEGEWWLIKKAHENKRLYEGLRTIGWCKKCGTALAKHELEYKMVSEPSIFVKFRVKGKNEFLIIWTTTPWTIPFNLGVMVNPKEDYVKMKAGEEIWIIAKALIGNVSHSSGKKLEIMEEFKGDAIDGVKYEHPFSEEIAEFRELEKNKKVHTVVLSEEYVDMSSGSGLVHLSPGTGPEDYEVGHKYGIPPFCNLSESGVFPETMGIFSGLVAKKDDEVIIEALDKRKALVAKVNIDHDYPHCWRCKSPIIFRATKQWFFRVEDMKEDMQELNKKIKWVPDFAGSKSFDAWLANLRDNSITKQRYWGTPLPVWKCKKCSDYVVVGSAEELKELAGEIPKDLHKPWIDEVTIKCKCGFKKERIPDVLDVWIDSGSASWNCLYYPQQKEFFNELFPADFILEGLDQIRGWFNLLFVASMAAMKRPSFKAVYMHGFINDSMGRKMSKSLGNYILPQEVIEKYGADTLRYYMIGGANPGIDINYNFDDMKVKNKNLLILWNLHKYLIDYSRQTGINPFLLVEPKLGAEELFILSKKNSITKRATEAFLDYRLNEAPWIVEELFIELSRGYVQMVREKSVFGTETEKKAIIYSVCDVLMTSLKLFSPISPFITEKIYQDLRKEFGLEEESIHLFDWPSYDAKKINNKLEEEMVIVNSILQAVFSARDRIHVGVRWPLAEIAVVSASREVADAVADLENIIKAQANVKKVSARSSFDAKPEGYERMEFKGGEICLYTKITPELEAEGFARELSRRIQNIRKKLGLKKADRIDLCIKAEHKVKSMLSKFDKQIAEKVGAHKISFREEGKYLLSFKEKIKESEIEILINKR